MKLSNFKKLGSSLLISIVAAGTVISCSSNNNIPLQIDDSLISSSSVSDAPSQFKFGFRLNSGAKKAKFDLRSTEREGSVDLRKFCSPVADQGQLGSCTAFAMGKGLREFLLIRDNKPLVPLSPLFLYYVERKIDGNVNEDAGSTMTTGMKALKEIGDSTEELWPYKISKFKKQPPKEAYDAAAAYELKETKSIDGLQGIKDELDKQNPVVFGFYVYSSFMKSKDGIIPVPDVDHEKLLGGHAVMAVGYDDAKQVLIMRNSWGTSWGDKGYFYMPYEYFKLNLVEDVWTASGLHRRGDPCLDVVGIHRLDVEADT